jgi:CheY-like chemotaxis protein
MGLVLVVEDDVMARYALAEWLRGEGHQVVGANSVDEALEVLSSRIEIDVVVTDVHMPGVMHGLHLTRHIRGGSHPLPVIVVSGDAREHEARDAGAVAFFRKPFDFEKVAERVAALMPFRPDAAYGRTVSER